MTRAELEAELEAVKRVNREHKEEQDLKRAIRLEKNKGSLFYKVVADLVNIVFGKKK